MKLRKYIDFICGDVCFSPASFSDVNTTKNQFFIGKQKDNSVISQKDRHLVLLFVEMRYDFDK